MDRKKFWRGLGAERWASDESTLAIGRQMVVVYGDPLNPYDANEVSLEVLLDGLERLTNNDAFVYRSKHCVSEVLEYFVAHDDEFNDLAHHPDRRTAIIAAICKLLGMEGE